MIVSDLEIAIASLSFASLLKPPPTRTSWDLGYEIIVCRVFVFLFRVLPAYCMSCPVSCIDSVKQFGATVVVQVELVLVTPSF